MYVYLHRANYLFILSIYDIDKIRLPEEATSQDSYGFFSVAENQMDGVIQYLHRANYRTFFFRPPVASSISGVEHRLPKLLIFGLSEKRIREEAPFG